MTQQEQAIIHLFHGITKNVECNVLEQLKQFNSSIAAINYQHGHPKEIIDTLVQMDKNPAKFNKKFPVIMLFQDFPEKYSDKPGSYEKTVTLQIVIANSTKGDYKAPQRYLNNFYPVLYPIYEELKRCIVRNKAIVCYSEHQLPHTKFDRVFWGTNGDYGTVKSIMTDRIDAIEIRDLTLTINYKNLIQPIQKIDGR